MIQELCWIGVQDFRVLWEKCWRFVFILILNGIDLFLLICYVITLANVWISQISPPFNCI